MNALFRPLLLGLGPILCFSFSTSPALGKGRTYGYKATPKFQTYHTKNIVRSPFNMLNHFTFTKIARLRYEMKTGKDLSKEEKLMHNLGYVGNATATVTMGSYLGWIGTSAFTSGSTMGFGVFTLVRNIVAGKGHIISRHIASRNKQNKLPTRSLSRNFKNASFFTVWTLENAFAGLTVGAIYMASMHILHGAEFYNAISPSIGNSSTQVALQWATAGAIVGVGKSAFDLLFSKPAE